MTLRTPSRQKGFSILHVLPMVAIVALIAVIGIKVIKPTSAAIPPVSCSYYFPYSSIAKSDVKSASVTIYNNGRYIYYTDALVVASAGTFKSSWKPMIRQQPVSTGKSYTYKMSISSPQAKTVTYLVKFQAFYKYADQDFGTWLTCGSKYVTMYY